MWAAYNIPIPTASTAVKRLELREGKGIINRKRKDMIGTHLTTEGLESASGDTELALETDDIRMRTDWEFAAEEAVVRGVVVAAGNT